MPEPSSLSSLLEEWRQLTVAESRAIRARDWPQVRACQQTKKQMQTLIQAPLPGAAAETAGPIRQAVEELLALEAANAEWLAKEAALFRARLQELEGSARNLKRVRASYASPGSAHWQSYS